MDTTTPRQARSLTATVRTVLLRNLLAAAAAVSAAWVVSATLVGGLAPATVVAVPAGVERPTPAERLVAAHDCWTDDAPAGVVPGHAVVTLPGAHPRVVPADVGFGIRLDGDPGTLHAFCP